MLQWCQSVFVRQRESEGLTDAMECNTDAKDQRQVIADRDTLEDTLQEAANTGFTTRVSNPFLA